jgi:hypothetical protein
VRVDSYCKTKYLRINIYSVFFIQQYASFRNEYLVVKIVRFKTGKKLSVNIVLIYEENQSIRA